MSYTASAAQTGSGVLFQINTGTILSPTWTVISEITDFTQSGKSNKTADVTNLQSPAEEFIATIQSPGTYDLTYNRVSADPGQAAVVSNFNNKTTVQFEVTLPKTASQTSTGDLYKFSAVVTELDDVSGVTATKQIMTKAKLQVSGAITFTAGS
jgi:hypothetical protein